jgi:hypothetical protein
VTRNNSVLPAHRVSPYCSRGQFGLGVSAPRFLLAAACAGEQPARHQVYGVSGPATAFRGTPCASVKRESSP